MHSIEGRLIRRLLAGAGWARDAQPTPDGVDWARFMELSVSHGVSGVLYHALSRGAHVGGPAGVPADVTARLRADFLRISAYRLANEKAVRELDEAVAGSGLAVCLIQGAALPDGLYESAGMRPMCDIDLLVAPDGLPRLRGLLAGLGYKSESDAPVIYTRGTVTLDVHTEPVEFSRFGGVTPLALTADALLRNSVPYTRPGGLLVPSETDVFMLACAHLMKHSFTRLIWFHDVMLLARRPGFAAQDTSGRAEAAGLAKAVYMSAELLKAYLGFDAGFPPPRGLGFLEARALEVLRRSGPVNGAGDLLYIAGMDGMHARVSYLMAVLSPPLRQAGLTGSAVSDGLHGGARAGRLGRNIRLGASAAYSLLKGSAS